MPYMPRSTTACARRRDLVCHHARGLAMVVYPSKLHLTYSKVTIEVTRTTRRVRKSEVWGHTFPFWGVGRFRGKFVSKLTILVWASASKLEMLSRRYCMVTDDRV